MCKLIVFAWDQTQLSWDTVEAKKGSKSKDEWGNLSPIQTSYSCSAANWDLVFGIVLVYVELLD